MQKDAYDAYKSALLAHKKRIIIDFIPNIHRAISALKHDCAAELYFVNWTGMENRICFVSATGKIILIPRYLFTAAEIAAYNKHIDKLVQTFAKYKDKSLLCRKAHDWLSINVRYDSDEANKNSYKLNNHNIIGPLIEHRAVCEGVSLAFQYILNRFGIDCMTVSGRAMKSEGQYYKDYHAWNVVSLNGENYHVDVTWDSPIDINGEMRPVYGYYCMPLRCFRDHICGYNLKCESLKENLFFKANRLFSSLEELKDFVSQSNPYNCSMLYISNLTYGEINKIVKKYSRYNYKIIRTTQWQQSGMIVLIK